MPNDLRDERVVRRLDQLVMRLAKETGVEEHFVGISVKVDEGNLIYPTEYAEKLIEIFKDYSENPIYKQILKLFEDHDVIEFEPDYDKFTLLLKNIKDKVEKPKIVFILGAGASKPNPSNIPTINEMLNLIISKLPPIENPMSNKIKEWSKRGGITIEDIMTAGYISTNLVSDASIHSLVGEIIYRAPTEGNRRGLIPRKQELRDIEYVISFKDLVDRVFSIVSGIMIQADSNAVHDNIARLIEKSSEYYDISILTTNYDVCMEKALLKYGLETSYSGMKPNDGIPLVKIHGSLNWYYCEGCQDVIIYDMDELNKFTKMYPTTASCLKCNTLTSLFMIPPIAYKYVMFPPIIEIWQSAMDELESADMIIVIGYSFSLSDDYILKMIVNGMKRKEIAFIIMNKTRNSVINLDNRLLSYHENIDLSLIKDASDSVPILVDLMLGVTGGEGAERKPAIN